MAKVKPGMYVRVPAHAPVGEDEMEKTYPRMFVLGMVREVDDMAASVRVKFFDLFDSKYIYGWALARDTFDLKDVNRAMSPAGFPCRVRAGENLVRGKVLMSLFGSDKEDYCYYVVELDGGELKRYTENQVLLDFTGVDFSPLRAMGNYEFQNPTWFVSRYTVSSTMHVLNNAIYGFRALAGCRTFLMTHQVTTVLRCLQSDHIRYMLADEVGMGKTIEACSIIKIQKEKNRKYRTAYIIPDQLVGQWRFELSSKFAIEADVTGDEISAKCRDVIIPLSELRENMNLFDCDHYDMIIVDETHKILRDNDQYNRVQMLSASHENILLLSATPVTGRREEYKRLLSLLDPNRYLNMPDDQFETLVDKQQELGDRLYDLYNWLGDYDENAEAMIQELKNLNELLADDELTKMLDPINTATFDKGKAAVQRILAYICEEYRMEKNIIRNRRGVLTLAERKLRVVSYEMAGDQVSYPEYNTVYELINWMENNRDTLTDVEFRDLLGAAYSSPWALKRVLEQYRDLPVDLYEAIDGWMVAAEAEIDSLDVVLDDPDKIRGRLVLAFDYLDQETDLANTTKDFKAVVFTSYSQTMTKFAEICRKRLGNDAVAVLANGMRHDELEEQATRFQTESACRLIICDPIGIEGRNLQSADLLLHLDTPWDIGQIEQRIGRLDRIGRKADRDVLSIVVHSENTIEEQLFTLWNDAIGVYTHSLCGLEIILDSILDMVMKAIRADMHYGLRDAMEDIRSEKDELDMELMREQYFDMASIQFHPLQVTIQNMLNVYQNKEDTIFAEAMMSWASQAGFVGRREKDIEGVSNEIVEFTSGKFSPKANTNAFFIPPKWDFYRIKQDAITGTFNRSMAIRQEHLLFFAPGDQVFDHIVSNALTCPRGRTCAVELISAPFNYRGLVLIWNVEPNMYYLYKHGIDPILMAKFRAYLPLEQIMTIWPEYEGYEDVTTTMLDELFRQKWLFRDNDDCKHLGKRKFDSKLGFSRLEKFMDDYPPIIWKNWLKEAYKGCEAKAREEVRNNMDIETARAEASRIIYAQEAVEHFYGQKTDRERDLQKKYDCVMKALEGFQLRLDAMIYLRAEK
ncbi:DEAD/DEAH box helicase family protein [Clostridiales bacterium FE2011]|nr:DEAD/DEAH box helicase family protein [Clostridiales bacterium FE2011]